MFLIPHSLQWIRLSCLIGIFVAGFGEIWGNTGQLGAQIPSAVVIEPDSVGRIRRVDSGEAAVAGERIGPGAVSRPDSQAAVDPRVTKLLRPTSEIRLQADYVSGSVPPDLAAEIDRETELGSGIERLGLLNPAGSVSIFDRYPAPMYHRPLYFEELNLERCGVGNGYFQNAVSGARFVTGTLLLPYRIATESPHVLVSSPGDCRSQQAFGTEIMPLRRGPGGWLQCRGVLSEAAVIAGFSFLLL